MHLTLAVVLGRNAARIAEGSATVGGRDDSILPPQGNEQSHESSLRVGTFRVKAFRLTSSH
jgi:hypothetical protein